MKQMKYINKKTTIFKVVKMMMIRIRIKKEKVILKKLSRMQNLCVLIRIRIKLIYLNILYSNNSIQKIRLC